jgi:hypothetical protein
MSPVYRPLVGFIATAMQNVLNLVCCAWGSF